MLNEFNLQIMRDALVFYRDRANQLTQDTLPIAESALDLIEALQRGDAITSLWWLDDVYSLDEDEDGNTRVTEAEAREVLRLSKSEHDASIGINWESLEAWLDYVRREHN